MQGSAFSYRTIAGPSEGAYREKGSRFLAFAYPVSSEHELREYIVSLEKKYFDARHHCYAWVLGPEKKLFRAHDAGEPGHSAGDPILGQIRAKDLTNVLVVVVRYFGGVKLGVGGLISAYKTAAADALAHAVIVEREVTAELEVQYAYEATADVMRLVRDFALAVKEQTFETDCTLIADYKLKDRVRLSEKLELMQSMGIRLRSKM